MKRLVPILLLPVLLALAAAVAAPKLASEERLRAEVADVLKRETGQAPNPGGRVGFSVLPWPAITVEDIEFDLPGTASLTIPSARLVLEIMPLLTGRVRAARIDLDQPVLAFADGASDHFDNVAGLIGALAAGTGSITLKVDDGAVVARRADARLDVLTDKIDGTFIWRGGRDVSADGDAMWRGEEVDFSFDLSQLAVLAKGGSGPTRLSLSAAPFALTFEGTASFAGGPIAEGDLQLSSPKLRQMLELVDVAAPTAEGFGAFALRAQARLSPAAAALSGARIDLDGNSSEGGVTVRIEKGRAVVQGSFASGTLDLSPYGRLSMSEANGREWSREPINVARLGAADLDLRLSAARVRAGDTRVDGVAASAFLKGGRLALTIGEAQAWNGSFRASANIAATPDGRGAEMRMDLAGDDVDLAASLGDLFRLQRLEGTGTFRMTFGGTGDSISAIIDRLNGNVTLDAGQGGIVGIDVARVLSRLERRPLSGGGSLRGGRTDFDRLQAKATIQQGVARVEQFAVGSPTVRIAVTGTVSLAGRDLDLQGTAGLIHAAASGSEPASFDLPFVIQGPWDSPFLLPDPQAMIRRSGAARPLLDGTASIGVAVPAP
ncbi:AsmA-like C-terminal region-containing protein [Bosea sp. 117]|uniref:AsmA family protein n=1 Tax=Bosea sp. 117 TaxID=1125973 RepID=UPI000494B157|nr:AsmA-like C-terminal region-containing protein [Bosea sp. 117]